MFERIRALLFTVAVLATVYTSQGYADDRQYWYRCNTHTHTASFPDSDANASAEYAVSWYKKHEYQCLVITDHEHLTPADHLNKEFGADGHFLVIRGEEITQSTVDATAPGGIRWSHVNGINTSKLILPVGMPDVLPANLYLGDAYIKYAPHMALSDTYRKNIDAVYAASGIPQINHPEGVTGPRLTDLTPLNRPFLFEVWNAFPSISPLGGKTDAGLVVPSFERLWDELLSDGKVSWAVASDDVHDYYNFDDRLAPTPGRAWIMIQAPSLKLDDIMAGLRKGRFYASTGVTLSHYKVDAAEITIDIDPPFTWKSTSVKENVLYHTRFIGKGGKVLAEVDGLNAKYKFHGDESYVRASIVNSDGRRAWTQPVFRDGRMASMQ